MNAKQIVKIVSKFFYVTFSMNEQKPTVRVMIPFFKVGLGMSLNFFVVKNK